MTMTIKAAKKAIVRFGFVILVFISAIAGAADIMFTSYPARALKVLGVDVDAQTVVFEAPDGVVANLTVGDIVGQEQAEISEIQKSRIILKKLQADSKGSKIIIPAIRTSSPVMPKRN